MNNIICFFILITLSILFDNSALAKDISWDKVSVRKITLFYPGVASWEFLNSEDHKLGGKNVSKGKKNCVDCHVDDKGVLDINANNIASGSLKKKKTNVPFEPKPISGGKKGFLDINVQSAYDDEYIYFRLQWQSSGSSWNNMSLAHDEKVDRVSIQLSRNNQEKGFLNKYGCFVSCHNDLNTMPNSPSDKKVKSNPYYSALKRDDVRLYTYYSRNGGWADFKKSNELEAILRDNGLIDLWQVSLGGKVTNVEDGWILEDRGKDEKQDFKAEGSWADGKYTVIIQRKLKTDDHKDIQLNLGDNINFGVAVHDDKTSKRQHYVNLPITIGIDTAGDIRAENVR